MSFGLMIDALGWVAVGRCCTIAAENLDMPSNKLRMWMLTRSSSDQQQEDSDVQRETAEQGVM